MMISFKKITDEGNPHGYDEVILTHLNYDGKGGAIAVCDGSLERLCADAVAFFLSSPCYHTASLDEGNYWFVVEEPDEEFRDRRYDDRVREAIAAAAAIALDAREEAERQLEDQLGLGDSSGRDDEDLDDEDLDD